MTGIGNQSLFPNQPCSLPLTSTYQSLLGALMPQNELEEGVVHGDIWPEYIPRKPMASETNESGLAWPHHTHTHTHTHTHIIKCRCLLKPLSPTPDSWKISSELQACHLIATQNIHLLGFSTLLTAQGNQTELQP